MRVNRKSAAAIERLEARQLLSIQAIGPEFRVNTFTHFYLRTPAIGMDADGEFVVTWWRTLEESNTQGDIANGIYARRYNSVGVAQGDEFQVNTFTNTTQRHPAIGMDADGDFVVAWESGYGQAPGIYAQRYDAAGVAQGGEFRVNTSTTSSQLSPAIGMDADGDFVIAWGSFPPSFDGNIFARRFNAAGIAQGAEIRVNTFTSNRQFDPTIGMDAEGDFVVAWSSNAQDGSNDGVYAQRYSAAGVAQGGELRVNTFTTNSQGSPAIGMDADGDFVITWDSSAQDGSDRGIYAQRYNATGVAQGGEFRVNTFTTSYQGLPAVGMDADGDFVLAWTSFGQDGSGFGNYAQRYNAAGVAQAAEFQVNSFTTGQQSRPAVGMDADGDFVVAWESYAQDGSGPGIYAQRYTVVPTVNASTFHFATAPHRLRFTFDENVSASLGTEDLIVQNLATMQTIPASDFSIAYDALTNTGTFSYTGSAAGIDGVLPDGNYRATLLAAGVTTPNGNPLASDHVLNFHFLLGDANHDARVNLDDFNVLAANFGQSPRDFTQGDFNYDNVVNLDDFNILAARFGVIVGPAAAASTAFAGRSSSLVRDIGLGDDDESLV